MITWKPRKWIEIHSENTFYNFKSYASKHTQTYTHIRPQNPETNSQSMLEIIDTSKIITHSDLYETSVRLEIISKGRRFA